MADLRTYFGAAVMMSLGLSFVAMLFTQSMINVGSTDTTKFPLAAKSTANLEAMANKSTQLSNSLNATFSQSTNVDITQGFLTSISSGGQLMSIVWSLFMLVIDTMNTIFLAPVATLLGPAYGIVLSLTIVYVVGLLVLVIAGVVLKWFI